MNSSTLQTKPQQQPDSTELFSQSFMRHASFPSRAIHLDFHTMPGIYDVGRDFDPELFARTLKKSGVEYINVFARCNLGFAYYPTKIGIVHPSLKLDMLGSMVTACHKQDIQVAAYFNAGLDHEHALQHREWCKVDKDGSVYDHKGMGHFFRKMCLNTGYGPHLLAMIKEVLDAYPVDGIFLDCFNMSPCYGIECLDGMKNAGLNPLDDQHAQNFCWKITDDFRQDVTCLVRSQGKQIKLLLNGLPFRWQPTHIELEVLPSGGWGYDVLPWQIRYARTLSKPYLTMTGRFHGGWGDFGGITTEPALLFDCYNSIANGGTCSIGDHMHPRGRLETEVYDLVSRVYQKTAAIDPWTTDAKPLAEIVIVNPKLQHYPSSEGFDFFGLAGATRMLSELKYQFDVSDGQGDLSKYKVVILPDDVLLSGELLLKIQKHIKQGGTLISSACAGLNSEKTQFALDEYKISYEGTEPHDPSFFVAEKEIARNLPRMPVTIYKPGVAIRAQQGGRVLASLMSSYFNKSSWDRYHENMYMPPDKETGRPALIQCGQVYHFSFPIFSGYYEDAVVAYKQLIKNCMERAFPQPLVKVRGMPSFGQVTVTSQGSHRMIHLLSYVPEMRGKKAQVIEEPIVVRGVEIALRVNGSPIRQVYLAPSREELDFQICDNYVHFTLPEVNGYQLAVVCIG